MPKTKKSSKKDTSDFIKKVASAGRGGDTELAYLSSTARDLLKKLGGAGTKNPKTKLKEYKAAARFAREPGVSRSAEESLAEFNRLNQPAAAPAAAQPLFGPTAAIAPTQPEATASPLSVRPAETTAPLFPTQTVQMPPPGRAAVQEEREPVARPGSAAQDMATMRAAEERAAQEAARQQAAQEAARQQAAQEAAARQQAEQAAAAARAAQQAPRQQAQPATTPRTRAQETVAREDTVRTRRDEEARRAEEQRRLAEAEAARRAQEQAAQEAARQEAARVAQEQAAAERAAEIVRQQERERTAALIREQEARERAPRTEESETITAPGSAAADLSQLTGASATPTLTPEQLAELAKINAAGFGNLTTGINMSGIGLGGSYMPGGPTAGAGTQFDEEGQRRAAEEAARKAAEEEANRRAAEEAAKRAAEEEAARKAAEDAARKAAEEEAARRAAEQDAARRAEEARRREEQDAAARRAAEEARRVAEEAEKRRLADEAARKAAEEEARRRAEEEKNRGPGTGGPGTGGPGAGGPGTGGPGGGGVKPPPGLIDSPLPTTPPPATQPPPSGGGIQPPPTTGGGTVPGGGMVRTHDFIDRNLNGIDDRDEKPSRGGGNYRTHDFIDRNLNGIDDRDEKPSRGGGGFNFGNFFGEDTDIGRLIGRIGGGRGRGGGGGGGKPSPGGGGKIPELPPTGGGLPSRPELPPTGGGPPVRPGPAPGSPPDFGGGGGFYTPTPGVTPGYQAAPLPVMPGAGTGTPFFNPNTGGLTPGTIPTGQTPTSLLTSNIPLQALGQNPNLGPTMLGGAENAGYYTDRFGNVILSPGAVKPPGRKKGGPASEKELLQLLQEQTEAEGYRDLDSARSMLDQLSNEPASSRTEVSLSPIAQSVRRTSRRPIREETDRGTARGMAMELEEVTKTQGPRTKGQTEESRQKMELIRETLGMPTFSQASLAREGDLLAKRFAEGGSVSGKFFGGFGPEVVPRGDALSRKYGSENPGTENFVNPSLTLSDAIKFLRNPDAEQYSDAIAATIAEQQEAIARQNRGLRAPPGGAVGGGRGGGLPYGGPTSYAGMYESPRKKATVTVEEIPQPPQGMNKGGDVKKKEDRQLTPYELMEGLGTGLATGVGRQIEGTAAMVSNPQETLNYLRSELETFIKEPEKIPQFVKDSVLEKWGRLSSGPEGAGEVLAEFLRLPGSGKGVPKRDIFIGEKAKTWDADANAQALALEKEGRSPEEIWQATQNFRGADGKWRQEISEDQMIFDVERFAKAPRFMEPPPVQKRVERFIRSLGSPSRNMYGIDRAKYDFGQIFFPYKKPARYEIADYVDYPALENAYPELGQGLIERGAPFSGVLGEANTKKNMTTVQVPPFYRGQGKSDPRRTLVHELQHHVQEKEGWSPGGASEIWQTKEMGYTPPDFIGETYRNAQAARRNKSLTREERAQAEKVIKDIEKTYSARNLYESLMGEAEARAASARTYMTPEERRARFPLMDFDVDFSKQLDIRKEGVFPSYYYSGLNPYSEKKK